MNARQLRTTNFVATGNGTGYLKPCSHCQRTIFMGRDHRGQWKPYDSWAAGDAAIGQWKVHHCPFR